MGVGPILAAKITLISQYHKFFLCILLSSLMKYSSFFLNKNKSIHINIIQTQHLIFPYSHKTKLTPPPLSTLPPFSFSHSLSLCYPLLFSLPCLHHLSRLKYSIMETNDFNLLPAIMCCTMHSAVYTQSCHKRLSFGYQCDPCLVASNITLYM